MTPQPPSRTPAPMIGDRKLGMRCQDIHRLVSEAMDRELSMTERVRVRSHLWVCAACTHFGRQMQMLRDAVRKMPPDEEPRE